MIKAAIFDVDGTILDTMRVWRTADEAYLNKLGIPFDEDVYKKMHTMTFETSVPFFRSAFGIDLPPEKIKEDILEELGRCYGEQVAPIPGAPELIKELYRRGVKMSVATSNRRDLVNAALSRLGLLSYFSHVLICDELGTGKHEPKIFLLAASLMETAPEETAVFEDSDHAVLTARSAGFVTVKVPEYDLSDENVRKELIMSL